MRTWPSGSFFGITRRITRILLLAVGLPLLVSYVGIQCYDRYKTNRLSRCVSALAQIDVGNPAIKTFGLIESFCAARPDATVFDKDSEPGITEFTFVNWLEWKYTPTPVLSHLPTRLRLALGLRYFYFFAAVKVDDGRVVRLSTSLVVEGRNLPLNAQWKDSTILSKYDNELLWRFVNAGSSDGRTYYFSGIDGTGVRGVVAHLTPEAPQNVRKAARRLNTSCATAFFGCSNVAALMPDAIHYVKWLSKQ